MNNDLKIIIDALIEKTKAAEANWRVSSAESEYSLYLDHSTITIGSVPYFSEITYVIRVYNEDGDIVSSADSSSEAEPELKELMSVLFGLAQETCLHAKRTLASVLEELQKSGVVGSDSDPKELPF